MLRTTSTAHHSPSIPTVNVYDQIRQAITGGDVKSAVVIAIGYLKAQPPSNLESAYSELQQIGEEMRNMEFISGIMNFKAESMFAAGRSTNLAPHNFNDEPGVVHYTSSTANAGIDSSANFDRTNFCDALKPEFPHMLPSEKEAVKTVVPMVGNVFDAGRNHVGTCLRVGDNTVLMPLHCARRLSDGGRVQFFNPQTSAHLRCEVVQILEQHAHIDMAVVQLKPVAMSLAQLKFAEIVLAGEKLFLLHYPKSTPGEFLQISGNQVQITETQDEMSMVVNHDTEFGSSGGVYVNIHGEIAGIHIGADRATEDILGRQKYACTMADALNELSCDSEIYDFLVPEGDLSKPELLELLQEVVDGNIAVPAGIAIGIAEKATIRAWCTTQKTYKYTVIEHMRIHCAETDNDPIKLLVLSLVDSSPNILGQADNYGSVQRHWGVGYAVECDHLLPKFVLKPHPIGTNNPTVRSFGVNKLPALAIEYRKHRNLSTTSSDTTFSSELIDLCNQHKIPEALAKVLDDYENNGLLTTRYKAGLLKLFNTPGQYYHDMVEKDIVASGMNVIDAAHCRTIMAACVAKIQSIV